MISFGSDWRAQPEAHVETEYSEETCAARWQELLEELVNSRPPRKPLGFAAATPTLSILPILPTGIFASFDLTSE
jgi:hypothetical protein